MLDDAARRGAKELLVLTGEKPEVNPEVAARLRDYGHADFTSYVAWACERALERGMLPHTNIGVGSRDELARLREVTASQGLMLESINPDLVVHQGSPTKHPDAAARVASAPPASCASRSRAGSSSASASRRRSASRRCEALAEVQRRVRPHPGGDPPELRPAPALLRRRSRREIADAGAARADRTREPAPLPAWAQPISLDDMRLLVRESLPS